MLQILLKVKENIQLTIQKKVQSRLISRYLDVWMYIRIAFIKFGEERCQVKKRDMITQSDSDKVRIYVLLLNPADSHLRFHNNIFCIFIKRHSDGSQLDMARRAYEEGDSQFIFQGIDLFGHSGL